MTGIFQVIERIADGAELVPDEAVEIIEARNNYLTRRRLEAYCTRHGIRNPPSITIWGENGPVTYADVKQHPKVIAKAQRNRAKPSLKPQAYSPQPARRAS